MTRQDIIYTLPLPDETRRRLLHDWDTFTPDEQYELNWILRDAYYAYIEEREQAAVVNGLTDASVVKDQAFYENISAQIADEVRLQSLESSNKGEIEHLRSQIQKIQSVSSAKVH